MSYSKKVCTLSYGCQMSERVAETLTAIAAQNGYSKVNEPEAAELIIINTCCVRESAENKIIGKMAQLKALKHKKPSLIICDAGCMVQQRACGKNSGKERPCRYLDRNF
jgi:tRNA-2-methylthio-N6-dimethylallyladenosine synthase